MASTFFLKKQQQNSDNMNLDKATITSLTVAILLPVMSMIGIEEITQNNIITLVSGIIALLIWYYNEKHNSDLISGKHECTCNRTVGEDED